MHGWLINGESVVLLQDRPSSNLAATVAITNPIHCASVRFPSTVAREYFASLRQASYISTRVDHRLCRGRWIDGCEDGAITYSSSGRR